MKRLIDNERFQSELMESLLFWSLQDDTRFLNTFGKSLIIKAEFKDKMNSEYSIEGKVGNTNFVVTSVHVYDEEETKGDPV